MRKLLLPVLLIFVICSCNPSNETSTPYEQAGDPDPSLSGPGRGYEIQGHQERTTSKVDSQNQRKHAFLHPYIQSINATVDTIKFFEGPYYPPPKDQRQYSVSFNARTARFINWELNLTHNPPGKVVNFQIKTEWSKYGKVFYRHTISSSIQPDWGNSYVSHSYSMAPWARGFYRVDLSIGGQKIASEYFDVYNADCSGDISFRDTDKVEALRREADSYRGGNNSQYQDALLRLGIALHNRGGQCFLNGNLDAAYEDFSDAIQLHSDFDMAHYHRALVLIDLKRPKEALADLNTAIKYYQQDDDYYAARGRAQFELENDSEALEDLNRAIDLNSKRPEYFHDRGIIFYYVGDDKNALRDLQEAASIYQSQNQHERYKVVAADIDILEGRKQGNLKLYDTGRAFTTAEIKKN